MSRIWKFGSDVDTDQIVPGRYAPYMLQEGEEVKDYAFFEARPDFSRQAQPGDIVVAADNFGCGSSREYAPLALKQRQVAAIVANSFARIFFRNAVNLGLPLFVAPAVVEAVNDGDEVVVALDNQTLLVNGRFYHLPALADFAREIVAAGGLVPYVRQHGRFPSQVAIARGRSSP
jgi:methanogen homoaconitase small subunit